MNSFKIEATTFTPEIRFDIENNTLTFLKVSKPADALAFYKPLLEFIDSFEKMKVKSKIAKELKVNFRFQYFNTATAKVLYELLGRLKRISLQGVDVIINWYYYAEDNDLYEEGEMMSDALDLPFRFIPIED